MKNLDGMNIVIGIQKESNMLMDGSVGGVSVSGVHWFCCATFVSCVYEHVAGIQIRTDGALDVF